MEWSAAAWDIQLEALKDKKKCKELPKVHYLGFFLQEDAATMQTAESATAGRILADWWDSSEEAGPQRRPAASFERELPSLTVLAVQDGVQLTTLWL